MLMSWKSPNLQNIKVILAMKTIVCICIQNGQNLHCLVSNSPINYWPSPCCIGVLHSKCVWTICVCVCVWDSHWGCRWPVSEPVCVDRYLFVLISLCGCQNSFSSERGRHNIHVSMCAHNTHRHTFPLLIHLYWFDNMVRGEVENEKRWIKGWRRRERTALLVHCVTAETWEDVSLIVSLTP